MKILYRGGRGRYFALSFGNGRGIFGQDYSSQQSPEPRFTKLPYELSCARSLALIKRIFKEMACQPLPILASFIIFANYMLLFFLSEFGEIQKSKMVGLITKSYNVITSNCGPLRKNLWMYCQSLRIYESPTRITYPPTLRTQKTIKGPG